MLQLPVPSVNKQQSKARQSPLYDYIRYPECRRLVNRIHTAQTERKFKSLAVLNQDGGTGNTLFTSVIAMGYMLFLEKQVLIIDTASDNREQSFYSREFTPHSCKNEDSTARNNGSIDIITAETLNRENLLHYSADFNPDVPAIYSDLRADEGTEFQINPFVSSIKDFFDLILIDTCAISQASRDSYDPMIIAEHADAAVMIIQEKALERDKLAALSRTLKRHRISPLGVVVNMGAK